MHMHAGWLAGWLAGWSVDTQFKLRDMRSCLCSLMPVPLRGCWYLVPACHLLQVDSVRYMHKWLMDAIQQQEELRFQLEDKEKEVEGLHNQMEDATRAKQARERQHASEIFEVCVCARACARARVCVCVCACVRARACVCAAPVLCGRRVVCVGDRSNACLTHVCVHVMYV